MFNLFNKKKHQSVGLTENESLFIKTIAEALSAKYPVFKKEFDLGVIVYVAPNRIGGPHSFVFGMNNDLWKEVCDPSIANFDIKNVKFLDNKKSRVAVDLYISEGLIIGYTLPVSVSEIDFATIDVSDVWEKHFLNNDYSEIEHVIGVLTRDQRRRLNMIKNTFRIQIADTAYYPIHDIEDGNYWAIDKNGSVFKITHDPFEASKVYDTLIELLEKEYLL